MQLFGNTILEVLDGTREPTTDERLRGVLSGIKIGAYSHLMARGKSGYAEDLAIIDAEDAADQLALEILAPRSEVLKRLKRRRLRPRSSEAAASAINLLQDAFGLPSAVAERYAWMLIYEQRAGRTFRDWLEPRG
jgi:hypothetical protein